MTGGGLPALSGIEGTGVAGAIAPVAPSTGPESGELHCRVSDDLFAVIGKCLGNGTGQCLVVDDRDRALGRIDLDSLRAAIKQGDARLAKGWRDLIKPLHGDDALLLPVLDDAGRLRDVVVNRATQPVQIARPDLSGLEFRLLLDAFLSTWISSCGEYLAAFQSQFAGLLGSRHAIAVSNGTMALQLALAALDIGPGDEVILPDLTFAATINAVLHAGARPVIVDVDAGWGIDVSKARRAITRKTRAIMPVHLYGRPAELGALSEIATPRGIALIEDCAEALGARYEDRAVGRFGAIGCFSFFANKTITTGEGGICVTDSDELAGRLKELRDHGMAPGKRYWHERVGFNGRMTNLQAAIGTGQLQRFGEIVERNRRIDSLYRRHLLGIPGVQFPSAPANHVEPAIWLVSVLVPPARRDPLIAAAKATGIELRPFFYPLSAMPPYRRYGRTGANSQALSQSGINLPTSNAVDETVAARLAQVFRDVLA